MARLNAYTIWCCAVVGLGGFTYGFGFSVFVTAEGQPGFYSSNNLDPTSISTARKLDAINALFTVGAAFGALAQSVVGDRWGRKWGLGIASVFSIVGAALAAGSVNVVMLIVVRLLHGFGLGMLLPLVPLYLSEVAPPQKRGLVSGVTVLSFGLGYLVCSWIAVGTNHAKPVVQWRVPMALATLSPLLLVLALPTIPESPRYLVWAGKKEQALQVLQRLHHGAGTGDQVDQGVRAEYTQIVLQVEHDKSEKAGFIQIFKKPTLRRRAILAMFLLFSVPSTGIIGISNYLPPIFTGLGLTGSMPLVMYGIWTTVGTSTTGVLIFFVDKFGRRRLLLCGYPLCALLLLSQSLLQNSFLDSNNKGGLAACLLFLLLYLMAFQILEAPAFIWASEIWPTAYRAKGISLGFFSFFVGSITYNSPNALAFKTIGWRMYLVYMGLNIVCVIIVYFFIQETKNLPMEELAALFGDEVVVHLTADGTGIVEDGKVDTVGKAESEGHHGASHDVTVQHVEENKV